MIQQCPPLTEAPSRQVNRRDFLIGGGLAAAGIFTVATASRILRPRASVFVARSQRYDGPLEQTIRDGLLASGIDAGAVRGKRVLLKPNMVEPTRDAPHVTTHPSVVLATAEVFRRWDAEVIVGEGT